MGKLLSLSSRAIASICLNAWHAGHIITGESSRLDRSALRMTFEKQARVGPFVANMTLDAAGRFYVSWTPRPPASLTATELRQYCGARNKLISEARRALSGRDATNALGAYTRATWL